MTQKYVHNMKFIHYY